MFTGLVQHIGTLARAEPTDAGTRLWIDFQGWSHRPSRGDSICVSGCCLTVAGEPEVLGPGVSGGSRPPGVCYPFVAIPETLAKTTLGELGAGDPVNLEHAATASTLLGGHLVQGHVDGVARVERVVTVGEWRVRIVPPRDLVPYLIPKGSITVDGVSLTIAATEIGSGSPQDPGFFEVALIPETLEKTTLDRLTPGCGVNIEADAMVKTIVHTMTHLSAWRALSGPTHDTGRGG